MASDDIVPPPEAMREAAANPGGWVYWIEGDYGPEAAVPREAIRGAWSVGDDGVITGPFLQNPNFVPATHRGDESEKTIRGSR